MISAERAGGYGCTKYLMALAYKVLPNCALLKKNDEMNYCFSVCFL